ICSTTRVCVPGARVLRRGSPPTGSARSTGCSNVWRRGSIRWRRRRATMRAPDFWGAAPGPVGGLLSGLLTPIGAAVDAAGRLRRAMVQPYHAPVPVACVGNLVAGGSGKTPVVLALAKALAGRRVAAHIVMRGYGGRAPGPLRVEPATHDALAVGD